MRIVHLAPFGPNRAGIYEAARDMVRADVLVGHDVTFVDVGVQTSTEREPCRVGAVDDRGGFALKTADPVVVDEAELVVAHSGVPDAWLVRTQCPLVFVMHGRPQASFRLELSRGISSYSCYAGVAKWPRTKALVHFWPEFQPYWRTVMPAHKLVALDFPPVDRERFAPDGERHVIERRHRGRYNGLICDSWREDVDPFDSLNAAVEAARKIPGLTWHLYGMDQTDGPTGMLIDALRRAGALGELCGRVPNMEQIYRSMDFVLTPHRIVTRVVGEALACGTPVVAADGCKVTPYTAPPHEPSSVAEEIRFLTTRLDKQAAEVREEALEAAERFSLSRYSAAINEVYSAAMGERCLQA